jgi:peptide/nickel transport system substrate-binding protein
MAAFKTNHYRILALICFTLLVLLGGCRERSSEPLLRIGLAEEPKTLNIWLASDRNSRKILSLIYQPLYSRDPQTLEQVPWLAAAPPEYDPDNLCYTVRLRPARWSDGSELTSADVAFTVKLIQEFRVPRHSSRWKFVEKIETPDPGTIKFYLKKPMAIFTTRSLTIPIVPRSQWESIAETAKTAKKPLAVLLNHTVKKPLGSGPFILEEWRPGAYLHMKKNPHFFANGLEIAGHRLGPYVDDMVFKTYGTSDVAILALKKGEIDMFWWGIQPGYIDDLEGQAGVRIFSNEKSALYFMGFNLRRAPFSDVHLRRAVAALINKEFIISRILQGHGTRMHSVVPAENSYWYCTDVNRIGDGLTREDRIKAAYKILSDAGYTWETPPVNAEGKIVPARQIRLPDGEPMARFTVLTPPADYDALRAMSGMMIQEWLRAMGMPAYARPMSFGALLDQVKSRHDFDAFVLGYGNLSLDPDYLRSFFHSKQNKPRGWNMSGYCNPEFDRLAEESSAAMDIKDRRQLIHEMQRIVMADVPYIPLYKPSVLEAVRRENFSGWVETLEGIGNIWSFCTLKPEADAG